MREYELTITETERDEISDCILSQIENVNKAKQLVRDQAALDALDAASKRLVALNNRVCNAKSIMVMGNA